MLYIYSTGVEINPCETKLPIAYFSNLQCNASSDDVRLREIDLLVIVLSAI